MSTEAIKVTKPRSDRPTYLAMVSNGIRTLSDRNGSSRQAILKYVVNAYNLNSKLAGVKVNGALRDGISKGELKHGKSMLFTIKA